MYFPNLAWTEDLYQILPRKASISTVVANTKKYIKNAVTRDC